MDRCKTTITPLTCFSLQVEDSILSVNHCSNDIFSVNFFALAKVHVCCTIHVSHHIEIGLIFKVSHLRGKCCHLLPLAGNQHVAQHDGERVFDNLAAKASIAEAQSGGRPLSFSV